MMRTGSSDARITVPSHRMEIGFGKLVVATRRFPAPRKRNTRLRIALPFLCSRTLNVEPAGIAYCCTVHLFSVPSSAGEVSCDTCGLSGFCCEGTVQQ